MTSEPAAQGREVESKQIPEEEKGEEEEGTTAGSVEDKDPNATKRATCEVHACTHM